MSNEYVTHHSVSSEQSSKPHSNMWITFEYLILFICLFISFSSLAGILNYIVDQTVMDPLSSTAYQTVGFYENMWLRIYLAGIIVTFPLFALFFLLTKSKELKKSEVKSLRSRKLLIYTTLVITAILLLIHMIVTTYNYLGGYGSLRSFLHLLVTLLLGGGIFGYLFFDVREDRTV